MTIKRDPIELPINEAEFDKVSLTAAPDWRYGVAAQLVSLSPSINEIRRLGPNARDCFESPEDFEVVMKVFEDFGDYPHHEPGCWWNDWGMYQFGLLAPEPKVQLRGLLSETDRQKAVEFSGLEELVLTIPRNLDKKQNVGQLSVLLDSVGLSATIKGEVAPRYQFIANGMREDVLIKAVEALRMYLDPQIKLWRIGFDLGFCRKDVSDIAKLEAPNSPYDDLKRSLAISARRVITQAILIAEHAARGRFFDDSPFDEARTEAYKRRAGRPRREPS